MSNTLNLGNGNWATKEDSLLAYNSENGNFKPLPFDFTRASSATVVNKAGLIETVGSGEPRIDFSNDAKGALLLEPTRSNLITYSEDFTNAIWTNTGAAISVNPTANLSPDGTLTGNEFNEGTSSQRRAIFEDLSVTANQINTLSVFVKKGTSNYLRLVIAENGDSGDWTAVQVDLSNNSLIIGNGSNNSFTDISSSISSVDYNGYYRLQLTAKHPTGTSLRLLFCTSNTASIAPSNSYGRPDYIGTNKTVFVWGCQFETNSSYATSYIPNFGNSAGATRVAENITQTTPNLSNSQEVTAFIDLGARPLTAINSTSNNFRLDFGAGNTRIIYNQNGSSNHRIELNINGSATYYTLSNLLTTTRVKIGVSVTPTTLVIYANGVEYHSVSIASADWSNLLAIETSITESIGNIKINDFKVYNTALTDAELIALTK
jgi:hypothetical protein